MKIKDIKLPILLKGRKIAKQFYKDFQEQTAAYKDKGIQTAIKIVLAGDDNASETYAGMIIKNCAKSGIDADIKRFDISVSTEEMISDINDLNSDSLIHGIIVMLPMYSHIDEKRVLNSVSPNKDIDGVHPVNAGKNVMGDDAFVPNTAQACADILEAYDIDVSGKHVVIVGRSNIVGKPLANLLIQKGRDATVTICHSRTADLKGICRSADILIAAVGRAKMIDAEYVNPDMVIVDVGMNEGISEDGSFKLIGDVDFDSVSEQVKAITPVPGGMSPLTNTALIKNILKAVKLQIN